MNIERQLQLDRSGEGLTEEEWNQGWHWCADWDQMLVGPGYLEALFCKCGLSKIEEWKKTEEALLLRKQLRERNIS